MAIVGPWEQPILEGWTTLAALAAVTERRDARPDGRREHVPQPGPDGEARDDPRPRRRRPGGPRHRRRLVRAGARRLRLRRDLGLRLRRAARPARRVGRCSCAACSTASGSPSTPAASTRCATPSCEPRPGPGPPADPDRRLRAEEDAPDDGPLRRRLEHRRDRRGAPREGRDPPRALRRGRPRTTTRSSGR